MARHDLKDVKIARVSTVPFFVATQLKGQVEFLEDIGMEVVLVCSPGDELDQIGFSPRLRHIALDIPRRISPLRDLAALFRLWATCLRERFAITHSTTPKAGLLTAVAAFAARVPVRVHTFTGQPWVTKQGWVRIVARLCDRIIGVLSTRCYADSPGQVEFLVSERIVRRDRISVIADGSLAGVDLQRFAPEKFTPQDRAGLRQSLHIAGDAAVIVFLGRICRDKGIHELLTAFGELVGRGYQADLLLVGPLDSGEESDVSRLIAAQDPGRVHLVGYTDCPERYLAISDINCLPSYREGFGTVVIEAAAMGVPTVGSRIAGLSDAVEDGVTGILVEPRDAGALGRSLMALLDDRERLRTLALAARERARRCYDAAFVNACLADEYLRLLQAAGKGR